MSLRAQIGGMLSSGGSVALPLRDQLLATGKVVAMYDATDASTLWADTSATTPATTTVQRIDDLSGNGNHLLSVGGSAVDKATKNGFTSVEGDSASTTKYLQRAFSISQPWDRVSAIYQKAWTSGRQIFGGGTAGANIGVLFQTGASPNIAIFDGAVLSANDEVLTDVMRVFERHNGASSRIGVNGNADVVGNSGTGVTTGTCIFVQSSLTVGYCSAGMLRMAMCTELTASERAIAEAWADEVRT
jgi:hypothetical protein